LGKYRVADEFCYINFFSVYGIHFSFIHVRAHSILLNKA